MKNLYLVNYSVKGIKTLDQLISLSFYKKTITKSFDTREYNVKGIYGMNGSGKSAIITSVDILKNLLTNPGYLSNPIAQKNLDEMINKKTGELFISADFIIKPNGSKETKADKSILFLMRYTVIISKNDAGKYVISSEKLSYKNAYSKKDYMVTAFEVNNGRVVDYVNDPEKIDNTFLELFLDKTINLLEENSICALFYEKELKSLLQKSHEEKFHILFFHLISLWFFGESLHVYLDQSDDHREYILHNAVDNLNDIETYAKQNHLFEYLISLDSDRLYVLSDTENIINKSEYQYFSNTVEKLFQFLRIFKSDLIRIDIDKKENQNCYICNLVMVYESYQINAEFESTGIKKLIKLFAYLREMVHGDIVFLDEFDSNLHDVYLCALLEYLMEYGEGQLCFTTHNVGPMDILRHHKKSIDFLSIDHKIYPWTSSGNYSPSRLYRNGMIEGSPFNVDSIDFIEVFSSDMEDD